MRWLALAIGIAAFAAGVSLSAERSFAADDTWVSAIGADAGGCTVSAPCQSLRYALAQTTAGGTITILSSGRYAPVRINKSVHITAEGVEAVIAGNGACDAVVCVDAGPNDIVSLRGLTILVPGPYVAEKHGIHFLGGAGLQLDNCQIAGVSTFGILFRPGRAAHLHVFDSKIAAAGHGVDLVPGGGALHAVFDRVAVHDGNQGIVFQGAGSGSIQGTIRDSLIAGHYGFSVWLAGGAASVPVTVMLDRSVVVNGSVGVEVGTGVRTIRIGDSVIGGHFQIPVEGAGIFSYGNNKIVDGVDSTIVPSKIPLK